MELFEKYSTLVDMAKQYNLAVETDNKVLKISGEVPSGTVKDKMWDIYKQIDPHFKSNDLVLNIEVKSREGSKVRVITKSSNLNIRKAPTTDDDIVGKAARGEIVTLLEKTNNNWWLIKTDDGVEGYCYSIYLEPVV